MNFPDPLDETSEIHAQATPLRSHGRPRTAGSNGSSLLAALAQEAHDVSLLIAATGSVVNAVVSGRRPQLRTAMSVYLPSHPLVFPSAIGTLAADALPSQTIQTLSALYGLVSFARSATVGYSAKREPGATKGPIGLDTLAEAWQAAAMQAIGVLTNIGYLDKSSSLNEDGKENVAALRLVEMLWGVTLGRSPCVRIDGDIIIPGWIERRTHLRREINAPATMTVNGIKHHVTMRDLSAGGVGLEGSKSVAPGDRVNVALGSGICFDGIAVWNRDGRIGVKLSKPMISPISED